MIRKDIQGLRAVAVIAVLLFHFWPDRVPGGYVGVDVFFVISGFLITSHLLRKPPVSRKMLVDFWARRVKRLIPAATLVLFVTVGASILWLPETMLQRTVYEAAAAAVYGENWMLAATATDYLASEDAASPIQHYWSLSIEEQYYAVWPIFIGGIFLLSRRFLTSNKLLSIGLAVIFTTSLVYSIYLTASNPAAAYFVTPTRMWELALGGIVALLITRLTVPVRIAVPMAWLGLAMIAATVVMFTTQTPFPGYTALLPTVGTALVILASTDNMKWSPRRLLGWRPSQFMGDISYSVYLWHWPVAVIAPFALGVDYLTFAQKIVLIGLVVMLSYFTKILVEDPIRSDRIMMKTNFRTYAYGIASILVVVVFSLGVATVNQSQVVLDQKTLEQAVKNHDPCLGAAAMRNDTCQSIEGEKILTTPQVAKADRSGLYDNGCVSRGDFGSQESCSFGDMDSEVRIALVGNSHAIHWHAALEAVAIKNGWRLDTYLITDCYTVDRLLMFDSSSKSENCLNWNRWAIGSVVRRGYDVVVMSNSSAIDIADIDERSQFNEKRKAYLNTIKLFDRSGVKVLAIRSIPSGGDSAPDCMAEHGDPSKCSNERHRVERKDNDPQYLAALGYDSPNVRAIAVDDSFCRDDTCYVVIGGLIAYFDGGHMTDTFSRTLAPDIEPFLKQLVEA